MLHPEYPRLPIHETCSYEAVDGDVEEEEDEGLESNVPDAVIRPWTMVVHFVDASIAFTAVVHSEHFQGTAFVTFHWVRGFLSFFVNIILIFFNFDSVIFLDPFLTIFVLFYSLFLGSKVVPLNVSWILWW